MVGEGVMSIGTELKEELKVTQVNIRSQALPPPGGSPGVIKGSKLVPCAILSPFGVRIWTWTEVLWSRKTLSSKTTRGVEDAI